MKPYFEKMATNMISAANPQLRVTVAAALRAAYVAGLERAAEIADNYEGSMMLERSDSPSIAAACEIADSIRAEKEADHG